MNKTLLRESFEAVRSIGLPAMDHFYTTLLTDYPELKGSFHGVDMASQQKKLFNALAFVIKNLDDPDTLVPVLEAMGERHGGYGVQDDHYACVGAALLKTLAFYFKDGWTPDLETAWTQAYQFLATTMIAAANKVEA